MLRVAGIVALIVLATACEQTNVKPATSPSPVIAQGNWSQNLTFAGEVTGQMSGIVPDTGGVKSECTGSKTHIGDNWAATIYGSVDSGGDTWGIVFFIENFSGPGTYVNNSVTVEMHSVDVSKVWKSREGDKVTFTIDRSQQTGTVDATLTNATSGKVGAQHITGLWNCRG
jgi:hypothetical protein